MVKRAGLLAYCCLVAIACGLPGPVSSPPPARGQIVTIHTGANPASIAVGGGYAWVANSAEGTVWKIDLTSNLVVGKVTVGDPSAIVGCISRNVHQTPHGDFRIRNCDLPKAVAVSKGAVWAGKGDTKSLVRIDPATDRVVDTIAVGVEPWYIAASDTAVWLSDWRTNTVVRVDPTDDRVVATIGGLPAGPTGLALSPGALWVASSRDNMLTRIDTSTNQIAATLATDKTPLPVAYAYGSIWVRNEFQEGTGTVQRVDPASNRVIATIPVGPEAGRDGIDGLGALEGGLWVSGLWLEKIDPATNRVVRKFNHTCGAVTAGAGALWTIDLAYSVSRITF